MTSRTNPLDDKTVGIREDLQAFTSLWSSLRSKYEGTNITKTIARLLHMYQPEDGIDAYERLLKTVVLLLEDFDPSGLRLLVSMVPPPTNSPQETIKEIFSRATGYTRLEAPIFQNQSLIPAVVNPTDDAKKDEDSSTSSSRNIPSEIASANINKKSNYQAPQTTPQRFYPATAFTPIETDMIVNQNCERMSYYTSNNGQVMLDPGNVPPGYKINWIPSPFMVQNGPPGLSNSYGDFIVKTEDNKFLRVPMGNVGVLMSPQNIQSYLPYQAIPSTRLNYPCEKTETISTITPPRYPIAFEKNKSNREKTDSTENNENPEISLLDNLTVSKTLEICIERFLDRVKNNADINSKIKPAVKKIQVSSNERSELFQSRDINYANDWEKNYYMKNSDMTAYKRQYYDSLLNYQRAKAVTNSMTPMPSTSTYDSSYYEYLQQHQWMYQQRLIMGHQYAQRLIQPEFSPLRNPYGRFNEWMPNCTTSRQSQEAFGYYSTNCPPDYEAMAKHKSNFSGESEVKKE